MNYLGCWTLYKKEVRRFLKVYNQTLIAPMVTSMLFLAVFSLAIGNRIQTLQGVPFQLFMVSGLIMMTIMQNAFANTSSSITMGKVLGVIIDILMPPIGPREFMIAAMVGGMTRGIVAGICVAFASCFFVSLSVYDIGLMLFYLIASSMLMSLLGIITGILSDSFDQTAAITSYIITPLTFLSGTFYSVKNLPEFWQIINLGNPFFYIIDGFRYSMTGYHDGSLLIGACFLISANIILFTIAYLMFKKGFRLKT